MTARELGNPTDKAWLMGWDSAIAGRPLACNPYRRRPQQRAWNAGWDAGNKSDDASVAIMRLRAERYAA